MRISIPSFCSWGVVVLSFQVSTLRKPRIGQSIRAVCDDNPFSKDNEYKFFIEQVHKNLRFFPREMENNMHFSVSIFQRLQNQHVCYLFLECDPYTSPPSHRVLSPIESGDRTSCAGFNCSLDLVLDSCRTKPQRAEAWPPELYPRTPVRARVFPNGFWTILQMECEEMWIKRIIDGN